MEAIGGRIFLESPPGAGTSLRVELPLTIDPAPLVAAQDAARGVADHLAFPAEAQLVSADDVRMGHGWRGGFARGFAAADGKRVMVAAFTRQHFADLAKTTRLAGTFAFLERVLYADFSACADCMRIGAPSP